MKHDYLHAISSWWQFNFWTGLACLVAGVAVISPLLLSKSFRKRFGRIDFDLEVLGLVVLVVAVILIGLYNHFWH
jgi:hypothetical protein